MPNQCCAKCGERSRKHFELSATCRADAEHHHDGSLKMAVTKAHLQQMTGSD